MLPSLRTVESRSPSLCSSFADEVTSLVARGGGVVGGKLDPRRCEDCTGERSRELDAELVAELGMRMQDVR
jgi:hypothetical protein